jgi:hypothetical protein
MNALIPVSSTPSRQELRNARKLLTPLAKCKVPGAAEQLAALDGLLRRAFPRRTADHHAEPVQRQQARRRGKQRRIIEARDCMGRCLACRGRKGWMPTSGLCCIICTTCRGTGVAPVGAGEYEKDESLLRGRANRARALRGDFASQHGVSILPAGHRGAIPHRRGFNGGRVIDTGSDELALEVGDWEDRCVRPDAADLSAALEGAARRRMKNPAACQLDHLLSAIDGDVRSYIKGRRLVKRSNREPGILTERQQKRAKQDRRVRRYQAEWNKAHRPEPTFAPRDLHSAAVAILERMGIDVQAALAAAAPPVDDTPTIAEARRRGDLPPDDLVVAEPDILLVRALAGPHAGETGRYSTSIIGAAVVRSGGVFERHCQRVARIVFDNGDVDLLHVDDVFPVSQLVGGAA